MSKALEEKVAELKTLLDDEAYRERLHPLEVIIARAAVEDGRHLKCASCLRWINALIAKMQGIEDYSNLPNTLERLKDDEDEDAADEQSEAQGLAQYPKDRHQQAAQ